VKSDCEGKGDDTRVFWGHSRSYAFTVLNVSARRSIALTSSSGGPMKTARVSSKS